MELIIKIKKHLDLEEISEFKNDYLLGMKLCDLSIKYKLTERQILGQARQNRIVRLFKPRKYNFDISYFKSIDSNEKAYWLGLLFADGCNIEKKGRITLGLAESDKYILEEFNKHLKHDRPLYCKKTTKPNTQNTCTLFLYDFTMSQDLARLGMTSRKSHTVSYPKIDKNYNSSFIRGVFDGDGCILCDKNFINPAFSIVGNQYLMTQIQDIMINEIGLSKTKMRIRLSSKNYSTYTICYGGTNNCKKIYDYLYQDGSDLFLTRKKEKFEAIFKTRDLNLIKNGRDKPLL